MKEHKCSRWASLIGLGTVGQRIFGRTIGCLEITVTLHPRSTNPLLLVEELIERANRSWNEDKVREHLQAPDSHVVLNIPLSSRSLADGWAWHYERSENFIVWSAYHLLRETKTRRAYWLEGRAATLDHTANQRQWKWNVKVPGVMKKFAWRLARNSIPTEQVKHQRHITDSSICIICNGTEDT